jgi:hypothetical protein
LKKKLTAKMVGDSLDLILKQSSVPGREGECRKISPRSPGKMKGHLSPFSAKKSAIEKVGQSYTLYDAQMTDNSRTFFTCHNVSPYQYPLFLSPSIHLLLPPQGFKKKAFDKTAGLIASLPSMVMSPSRAAANNARAMGRKTSFGFNGELVHFPYWVLGRGFGVKEGLS